MSNRRFEMYQYRQAVVRMRQGDSDRVIARSGLMGRKKLKAIREQAAILGWLSPDLPLPDDGTLAGAFSPPSGSPASSVSSLAPFLGVPSCRCAPSAVSPTPTARRWSGSGRHPCEADQTGKPFHGGGSHAARGAGLANAGYSVVPPVGRAHWAELPCLDPCPVQRQGAGEPAGRAGGAATGEEGRGGAAERRLCTGDGLRSATVADGQGHPCQGAEPAGRTTWRTIPDRADRGPPSASPRSRNYPAARPAPPSPANGCW